MEEEIKINKIVPANKMFVLAAILVVTIVGFLILKTVYNFKSLPQNYPQQISVSGEGKSYAKPDIAVVRVGVHSEASKSQNAVDQNNRIMNEIIASIKALGIEEKDITTTSYHLSPLYDYTEGGRVFKGYSLDQQLQVKIRNFEKISEVLDRASSLGANTIGDLQFTVDNPEAARAEARAKAIEQAKEKAVSIFNQAGLKMGKLINVYEGGFGGCGTGCPQPMYGMAEGMGKDLSIAPDILPGQLEINSNVTLIYLVK